jgi:Zn-dependent peptidase ImmA (M78 family)/DNA-binding XRE family transcriptional regulator
MNEYSIGQNVARLRIESGKTQEEVAKSAEISITALKNIESGTEPTISTLQAIAKALDVPFVVLLSEENTLTHVRLRADKQLKRRAYILAIVSRWLGTYINLEKLLAEGLGTQPKYKKTYENLEKVIQAFENSVEEPDLKARNAAEKVRGLLGEDSNIKSLGKADEPIQNICGLLQVAGIKIFGLDLSSTNFFGLSVGPKDGGPAIVVNNWDRISVERKIFTAAHEFGHLVLHLNEKTYNIQNQEENRQEEIEANVFASYFLMPHSSFEKKRKEFSGLTLVERVNHLKKHFKVSYQSVLVRLANSNREEYFRLKDRYCAEYRMVHGKNLSITDEPEPLDQEVFNTYYPYPPAMKPEEPNNLSSDYFFEARLPYMVRLALEYELLDKDKAVEILDTTPEQFERQFTDWKMDSWSPDELQAIW